MFYEFFGCIFNLLLIFHIFQYKYFYITSKRHDIINNLYQKKKLIRYYKGLLNLLKLKDELNMKQKSM